MLWVLKRIVTLSSSSRWLLKTLWTQNVKKSTAVLTAWGLLESWIFRRTGPTAPRLIRHCIFHVTSFFFLRSSSRMLIMLKSIHIWPLGALISKWYLWVRMRKRCRSKNTVCHHFGQDTAKSAHDTGSELRIADQSGNKLGITLNLFLN